jgi:hypothetical protein
MERRFLAFGFRVNRRAQRQHVGAAGRPLGLGGMPSMTTSNAILKC